MSRRKRKIKRIEFVDLGFEDRLIHKFINIIMKNGKKSVAEKIVHGALGMVKNQLGEDSIKIFRKVLDNIKPQMEVRSRRVGGSNYQIPMEVRSERKLALGLRWLRDGAVARREKTMASALSMELYEAYLGKGSAIKRRDEIHKVADSNRAYSHLKWQ